VGPAALFFGAFAIAVAVGFSLVWGTPIVALPVFLVFGALWAGYSFLHRARGEPSLFRVAKDELDQERGSPVPPR
jgi:hypothetical protein